jgi:hypothetical protein
VIFKDSDKFREKIPFYCEPLLATGCAHQGEKIGITRSKYVRYAVINQLIKDGYPLNKLSSKFNKFYEAMSSKQ